MGTRAWIGAALAVGMLGAGAGPAMADGTTGPVVITQATPGLPFAYSFGDVNGKLQVFAEEDLADGRTSPGPVTAVSLHLQLRGGTASVDVPLSLTSAWDGYWTAADRVRLPQFGVYDVTAEIKDEAGSDVLMQGLGTDTYSALADVTSIHVVPALLDYDHRTLTVTGHVAARDPWDGSPLPLDRVEVGVGAAQGLATAPEVEPDANGDFSATVTVEAGPTLSFGARVTGTGATPYQPGTSATSNSVSITRQPTRIRMLTPVNLKAAKAPVQLRGIVERLSGSTWLPVSDVPVNNDSSVISPTTSGADGTFTVQTVHPGGYTFSTPGDPAGYSTGVFLAPGTGPRVQVHIPQPAVFNWLSYDEDQFGEAEIHASLSVPGNQMVRIEYSADRRTWHYVGQLRNKNGESTIYATYGGTGNGYWRLYFAGNADYKPVYSSVMHMYRTPTRLTGGLPSTRNAHRHQVLRFSGSLQQRLGGTWRPVPHKRVLLLWRRTGSKQWYAEAQATTDSHGHYRVSARVPAGGTWTVVYLDTSGRLVDAFGPMTWVRA